MADKIQGNGTLSLVGAGTTIEGKLKSDGSVRIDGKVVGDVAAKSNVTVGATGTVDGTISAANISLAGRVLGTLIASEKLVLENKSVMRGDIRAAKLVVDEGAVFDGQCAMSAPTPAPAQPPSHVPPKEKER
jgi:cytoskeletal protein CcmA (bactofilin family)